MIHYEVYIIGKDNCAFHTFESMATIKEGARLFIEKEGVLYTVNVIKITHNLTHTDKQHVVRLNGHSKVYIKTI